MRCTCLPHLLELAILKSTNQRDVPPFSYIISRYTISCYRYKSRSNCVLCPTTKPDRIKAGRIILNLKKWFQLSIFFTLYVNKN